MPWQLRWIAHAYDEPDNKKAAIPGILVISAKETNYRNGA